MKVSRVSPWLVAAGLWCAAVTVNATPVTLVGDSVNYVYDDSQAAIALFGTPQIVGDAIRFLPPNYRTQSLDGDGTVMVEAEFIFSSVYTQDGTGLGEIAVFERGDYRFSAGSVGAEVGLTVGDNRSEESAVAVQSFTDDTNADELQLFELSAGLDLGLELSAATDDISVTIRNLLTATSAGAGELAWIQKKLAFAVVTTTGEPVKPEPVPAPGVLALFGVGLLALGGARRRKNKNDS